MLGDALSYFWLIFWLRRTSAREERNRPETKTSIVADIKEGLAFVLKNRYLQAIAMTTSTSNFFSSVMYAVVMVFLVRELDLSAGTIGLLFLDHFDRRAHRCRTGLASDQQVRSGPDDLVVPNPDRAVHADLSPLRKMRELPSEAPES